MHVVYATRIQVALNLCMILGNFNRQYDILWTIKVWTYKKENKKKRKK